MNQARKPIYSVFLLLILAGALSLAAIVLTPFVNDTAASEKGARQ